MKNYITAVLITGLMLTGCASNQVSFNKWQSKVTFIDSNGRIKYGTAIFHYSYRDGTMEIQTNDGNNLKGAFVTQTASSKGTSTSLASIVATNDNITIPVLSNSDNKSGNSSGTAYLEFNNQVVWLCAISVSFQTMGMGDAQMIGSGVCADKDKNKSTIMFSRQ